MFLHAFNKRCLSTTVSLYNQPTTQTGSPLTSCSELHDEMQKPNWQNKLRVVDARWFRDPKDYRALHMENRIKFSNNFHSWSVKAHHLHL